MTVALLADESQRDHQLVNRVMGLFGRARDAKRARLSTWEKNYRILYNRTWADSRGAHLPSPTSSETYPVIAALVGWMTDRRPELECVPVADQNSVLYDQLLEPSRDLEALLRSNWYTHDYGAHVETTLFDGFSYGTGCLKVYWDQTLEGGKGDAMMCRVDPWALYPDPDATDYENAGYIIEARRVSIDYIEERWPGSADRVGAGGVAIDQRPDTYMSGSFPRPNLGGVGGNTPGNYGSPGGRGPASWSGATVVLIEAWLRENDPDNGVGYRYVAIAGDTVLMDEMAVDLWGHGRHPYIRYQFQDLGELWGMSLIEHIADHQLSINRLLAAYQNNIELLGDPIFMQDTRAGISRAQLKARAGQRLTKGTGGEAGWVQPVPMPPETVNLINMHKSDIERVSGLAAIARGSLPTGRNAEGVIDSVQESSFVRIRLGLRNLERTLRQAGELLANLIAMNYTQPRVTSIVGPSGERTVQAFHQRHFYRTLTDEAPMRFAVFVKPGSSQPISRQQRAQEAMTLFTLGVLDARALLVAMDWPGADQIASKVEAMQAAGVWQPPNARQSSRGTSA